jgi:hypothetical protein
VIFKAFFKIGNITLKVVLAASLAGKKAALQLKPPTSFKMILVSGQNTSFTFLVVFSAF